MESPFSQMNSYVNQLPRNKGRLDAVLIFRLVIAAALLAAALLLDLAPVWKTILLILSALAAGYDIVLDLVDAVTDHKILSTPAIVVLVAVLSFLVGIGWEGAFLTILYQLGRILVQYAAARTRNSARELIDRSNADLAERASVIMEQEHAGDMSLEKDIQNASSLVLKALVVIAVLFTVCMPIFTSLSVKEAIRRGMILLIVSLPFSVTVSLPLAGIVGLGFATRFGAFFNNARVMEKLQSVKTAVLDKSGIFADNQPVFVGVKTDVLDEKTFMEFVSHAVFYSDQAFAKAILAAEDREYRLDLISDFKDIPGSGVDVKIGGADVTLAKRELLTERGEAVPYEGKEENSVYYLMVAGKYIGKVLMSENLNKQNLRLIPNLKSAGIEKCVLLTEDSREESETLGMNLNADEVYAEFTENTKLQYLESIDQSETMYIYANSLQAHSNAAVDVRVSQKGKYADALVEPDDLELFPEAIKLSQRIREVAVENVLLVFIVKAIMLFLALTGNCTVWFALFMDIVSALGTILNSVRVTKEPLIQLPKL